MDVLTKEEIKQITRHTDSPCVSIFMPTHRAGSETDKDRIRFKNLVRTAREKLTGYGLNAGQAESLLSPAEKFISDTLFWQHQSDGLAVFISGDHFVHYRLPVRFGAKVLVGERYHVKPLLPVITGDGRFLILALSQNQVRLFQGSRFSVTPVEDMGDIPLSLVEALGPDEDEDNLQYRAGSAGGQTAIYHGHADEDRKKELFNFFNRVDDGLTELLGDDGAPLVLAGVEYLHPIYHRANSYPHLIEQGITGNPENLRPEELHKEAWEIVKPHFRRKEKESAERYLDMQGTGVTSDNIKEVVPAASHGRVGSLFIARREHLWGTYCEETAEVEVVDEDRPGNEDLLDLACVYTLNSGGTVYVVPRDRVPGSEPLAAILRW